MALNTNSNLGGDVKCTFCRGLHTSLKCDDIVKDVDSLIENNRCFLCLGSGHGSHSCSLKIMYNGCGRKHHTSLCKETAESNGLIANTRATMSLRCYVATLLR